MKPLFYVVECLAFRPRKNLSPLTLRVCVAITDFSAALSVRHWFKIWSIYPDGEALVARRCEEF